MTPEEARALLDGTTPAEDWWHSVKGGWVRHLEPVGIDAAGELDVTEDDAALIVAAPALAAMIAGMRPEYRAEQQVHVGVWLPICGWYDHYTAQFFATVVGEGVTRVVRRYVTTPEEA